MRKASAALANEQGINADINATLVRNWQLGGTQGVETQALREQAAGYADQVLNNCMRRERIHPGRVTPFARSRVGPAPGAPNPTPPGS